MFALASATWFAALAAAILFISPKFEATAVVVVGQDFEKSDGPPRKNPEAVTTLASIADSEEVIRLAVERTGLQAFPRVGGPHEGPLFLRLRRSVFPNRSAAPKELSQIEAVLAGVVGKVRVRTEPLSEVIRISFQHTDPEFAAVFTNNLAQAFVDRQLQLSAHAGAADFFSQQARMVDNELQSLFSELQVFVREHKIYALDEQRELLLRRIYEALAALSQTRISILEKQGQRQAISAQLRRLAPVARSPYVSGLVNTFGDNSEGQFGRSQDRTAIDDRMSDPPLLLVRAYQDSITNLFRVSAELTGLEKAEKEQASEVERLEMSLRQLINGEATFTSLRRAIGTTLKNKEALEARMLEERLSQEARAAKLSSVKVFQKAAPTQSPVFPRYNVVFPFALVISVGVGALVAHLWASTERKLSRRGKLVNAGSPA